MGGRSNKLDEIPVITMRRGKTTFKIGLCFNNKSKDTLDDRIKKMIRKEVNKHDC